MNRKGSEIAMNIIIIAVIALVVMVVVLYIFGNKSANITKTTDDCATKYGECLLKNECTGRPMIDNTNCEATGQKCCIKLA